MCTEVDRSPKKVIIPVHSSWQCAVPADLVQQVGIPALWLFHQKDGGSEADQWIILQLIFTSVRHRHSQPPFKAWLSVRSVCGKLNDRLFSNKKWWSSLSLECLWISVIWWPCENSTPCFVIQLDFEDCATVLELCVLHLSLCNK